MSIKNLLTPASIALIGASEKKGFSGWTAQNLLEKEDHMKVYFVNPTKEQVFGKKCYHALSELPEKVECIVLTVAKERVLPYIQEAGEMGIRAAVVYASGYSEEHSEEGRRMERELKETAERYEMTLLGPNCMGAFNRVDDINLLGMRANPGVPFPGIKPSIALMGHSGALLASTSMRPGFPLAYLVSVGNGVTPLEEFIDYMVDNDDCRVIALYLEGLKRADLFVEALRKAALKRKPVVILKAGKSARTAASAASHTGSLAGSYRAFQAMCERFGVILVDSLEELICISEALTTMNGKLPANPKIVSMNSSGGFNTLVTEALDGQQIPIGEFSTEAKAEIAKYLPSFATIANPLDTTTALLGDPARVLSILRAIEKDEQVGLVMVGCDIGDSHGGFGDFAMAQAMLNGREEGLQKPYFISGLLEKTKNNTSREAFMKAGICLMPSLPTTARCLKKILDFAAFDPQSADLAPRGAGPEGHPSSSYALGEIESKELLAPCGIPTPQTVLVRDPAEIDQIGIQYPVVMKIASADITHKTNAGGVKLGIGSPEEAKAAYEEIMASCRAYDPQARLDGIQIQEQAEAGTELILGISQDAQLGPMLLVGLGGIFVEIFRDTALSPCPVDENQARAMLKSLKAYKLFTGYRGAKPLDEDAVVKAMSALSRFADEHREEIKEIDVNPIFVYEQGKGIKAVDALVVKYGERRN